MSINGTEREAGPDEIRLSKGLMQPAEQTIIDNLSPANIDKIRALHKDRLVSVRDDVVVIRAEDLIFLLQCIQEGYIPVAILEEGQVSLMDKHPGFFTYPNIEHPYFAEHPELLAPEWVEPTFPKALQKVHSTWGNVAKKNAIIRNLFRFIKNPNTVLEALQTP